MTPKEAYVDYCALKAHFAPGGKYDYHKYRGKGKWGGSFESNPAFHVAAKIAKHRDPHGLLLSALSRDPTMYIRDVLSEENQAAWTAWSRWQQAPAHWVAEDLWGLGAVQFNSLFKVQDGRLPPILGGMIAGRICLDTLCVICCICDPQDAWDSLLKDHPLWPDIRWRIERYMPFLKDVDLAAIKKQLIERYSE